MTELFDPCAETRGLAIRRGDLLDREDVRGCIEQADNVDNVDFFEYTAKPGTFGGTQYYGTGHEPVKGENGRIRITVEVTNKRGLVF